MARFLLDVVYGFVFITVGTLVVFVLLPSGKMDTANVAFAMLFGVVFGIPAGIVFAVGRVIVRSFSS